MSAHEDNYAVSFEFTVEQTVFVKAASKKAAIQKVKNGDYSNDECETTTIPGRRKWAGAKEDS